MEADPRRRSGPVGAGSEGGFQGAAEADLTERWREPSTVAKPKAAANPNAVPTNPLAVLTPGQVRAQATNTINSAYSPVYTELNMEQSQEQAIIDKQTSDNQYYEQWANAKMQSVQARAGHGRQLHELARAAADQQLEHRAGRSTAAAHQRRQCNARYEQRTVVHRWAVRAGHVPHCR